MGNNLVEYIKEHLIYPLTLAGGYAGNQAGFGKFIADNHIIEKIVDGFIGVVFAMIVLVCTHYGRKYLRKCDVARAKRKRNAEE